VAKQTPHHLSPSQQNPILLPKLVGADGEEDVVADDPAFMIPTTMRTCVIGSSASHVDSMPERMILDI
jgi:hypothetical protein